MLIHMNETELKAAVSKYISATNAVEDALSQGTDLDKLWDTTKVTGL